MKIPNFPKYPSVSIIFDELKKSTIFFYRVHKNTFLTMCATKFKISSLASNFSIEFNK